MVNPIVFKGLCHESGSAAVTDVSMMSHQVNGEKPFRVVPTPPDHRGFDSPCDNYPFLSSRLFDETGSPPRPLNRRTSAVRRSTSQSATTATRADLRASRWMRSHTSRASTRSPGAARRSSGCVSPTKQGRRPRPIPCATAPASVRVPLSRSRTRPSSMWLSSHPRCRRPSRVGQ
jgi:hypothetical protein